MFQRAFIKFVKVVKETKDFLIKSLDHNSKKRDTTNLLPLYLERLLIFESPQGTLYFVCCFRYRKKRKQFELISRKWNLARFETTLVTNVMWIQCNDSYHKWSKKNLSQLFSVIVKFDFNEIQLNYSDSFYSVRFTSPCASNSILPQRIGTKILANQNDTTGCGKIEFCAFDW